jgi:hypothetical protein
MNVAIGGMYKAVSGSISAGQGSESETTKQAMAMFDTEISLTIVRALDHHHM